jgi:serine/threonine-protein kinase RsbW
MNNELKRTLAPSQEQIETFCWDFQQWLDPKLTSKQAFAAELLLREALVNAVEHGARDANGAPVEVRVRASARRILIAVQDPGPGFDWKSRQQRDTAEDACSGRGMLIYKNYAQRIRFNTSGNFVALSMDLSIQF